MTKTKLKITGLILALMMLISMFGMFSITAFAVESDYPYAVEDTETGIITIDGTLGSKTEATEADMEELASFLESSINKGKTSFIVTGENQAIYAYTAESRYPVVGFAIAQMPYDHNGTIDVIYRDATELLKEELAVCCSLRTVALPNVSNCGDDAFSDCYYLENLEFGSVVTSVGEDAFHDVDRYVDGGCELVLNCGQMQTESYKPNLDTSEWAGHTWKSITLTHTPEADDGDCTTPILCSTCGEIAEEGKESHTTTEESNKATCTTKAVCDLCGTEYGEPAPNAHSFVDGKCACGIKQFDIYGQQLNVGGDLSMKYYVTALGDGVSTETLTMEFLFLGKKTEVSGVYDSETRMYVFTLDGINPQCMGDEIDAYLLLDGEEKANKLDYTVEANLLTLREKYKDDTALVTLVNDILAYGSAASEYKGYGSMTDDYISSDREIPTTNVAPSDAFTGYTVTFGQMNYIKIRVNLADGNTLYLGETDITNELVDGIYKTAGIAPTDFDNVFNFTIKNGEETVATFALSVNDYISAMQNDASIGNLVKALYNYGVSAEVYEHRFTGEGEHVYVETAPNDNQTHKVICVCGHEVTEAHELVDGKCECGVYEITIGNVTAKNFDGTDRVWKSGDTIKVDVWDKDNGGYERTELTYDGTSWGSIITDTKNPVVFAVIGNGDAFANKNSYDIFVYDQQEQSQNVDDYDLMYAYKASINTDAQLDLHFEHLFTKITLNIEYGSEFTETPKIEYVLFVSEPLKPFVTITGINDGNLNFEYAEAWVHPSKFINYGDEADMTDDTVEVIVGIGTLPAGYDFIHFYDRFGTTEPWKKVLVPEGGLTFKDGEEYEFKILITADGAYIVCNDGCTDFTYTVGENGTHTKTCADCGYEATETHSFDDGVVQD